MLIEIQSDAFRTNKGLAYEKIRRKIAFNSGLNVVLGTNEATNSIGKSNFLMCLDFVFGGNDYIDKLKNIFSNIGDHEINFGFKFKDKEFYFCRRTSNPDDIFICDGNYKKSEEKWPLKIYMDWLKRKYEISNKESWRSIVGRFIRVYNRENGNEKEPLRIASNEPPSVAIVNLLKLFNYYQAVKESAEDYEEAKNKSSTFSKAQDYKFIPRINKLQYDKNLKEIKNLEKQKSELEAKSNKDLTDLNSEKANLIRDLKSELYIFRRKRGKYYDALNIIKNNNDMKLEISKNDFKDLEQFFPGQINIDRLSKIEEFNKNIVKILDLNIKSALDDLYESINLVNIQIDNLEKKIKEYGSYTTLSKVILTSFSNLDRQIEELRKQNEKYDDLQILMNDKKNKEKEYTKVQMKEEERLQNMLNSQMDELNSLIFGKGKNTPKIKFNSTKSYNFYTLNDDGTGTTYKGLIIFDLVCLKNTDVPFLVHDSFLFKNISHSSMDALIELYKNCGHQVFIAIDDISIYSAETQKTLTEATVLRLGDGGECLYGSKW